MVIKLLKIAVVLSFIHVNCVSLSPRRTLASRFIRPTDQAITYAGQFDSPWLALIYIKNERCGGSLINKKFVLTAAHCFDNYEDLSPTNPTNIKVYFGEWILGRDPDCSEESDDEICERVAEIPPEKIVIHQMYEDYKKKDMDERFNFDIALIQVKRPPRESGIVTSIQLPQAEHCSSDFVGVAMTTTGFGLKNLTEYVNKKKRIDLTILNAATCKDKSEKKFNESVHASRRGGGVTNVDGETPILQGIISYGAADCERALNVNNTIPSVFLKVSCFIDWINTMTGIKVESVTTQSATSKPIVIGSDDINVEPW